jgi:hypothetical protein
MKFSLAFVFATLSLASAQQDAQRKTVKEQMMEHRKDMFVNNQVSKTKNPSGWIAVVVSAKLTNLSLCAALHL